MKPYFYHTHNLTADEVMDLYWPHPRARVRVKAWQRPNEDGAMREGVLWKPEDGQWAWHELPFEWPVKKRRLKSFEYSP